MSNRKWTEKELDYLFAKWGVLPPKTIAKSLKRTESGVRYKAYKLGLGDVRNNIDGLTIYKLAEALNISQSVVMNFINLYGLPSKKFVVSDKQEITYININDFWKWLEQNKERVDFRKFERYSLGNEPSWVEEQRRADHYDVKKQKHYSEWTAWEVTELKRMLNEFKYTRYEIAEALNRTPEAITAKIAKLGLKVRPIEVEVKSKKYWTKEETEILITLLEQGASRKEIAERINKSEGAIKNKIRRLKSS